MEEFSQAVGKIVIAKFHENQDRANRNEIITRTFGKFGVISTAWYNDKRPDQVPKAQEFWRVKILKEVNAGQRSGCFVLEPLKKLAGGAADLDKLLPGFYRESFSNGILIVTPKSYLKSEGDKPKNWILPLAIKKEVEGPYAILVDLLTVIISIGIVCLQNTQLLS